MNRPPLSIGFSVPFAFSAEGALVRPEHADRSGEYRCPGCSTPVTLRRGTKRRPHFAHRADDGCSTESVLHRTAKRLVRQVVDEWLTAGGPRPCIARSCSEHGCGSGITQDLPDDLVGVEEEVRLADGTIGDVVLFRADGPAAVIEIRATHRVSPEKAARIQLPWVELEATDVLDRPYWWVPVNDGLLPFDCPACSKRRRASVAEASEVHSRLAEVSEAVGQRLPPSPPYQYAVHTCWRCASEMVVFAWPGAGRHSTVAPPSPIPQTVQLRFSEAWGSEYWANCCPSCSAVQGDHFLRTGSWDYVRILNLVNGQGF